jgi:O-antigen/teichoic acid export membrane protein
MKERSNTVQTFWVSLGSLFSFGFAIVSSMIFSRYFLKEDYGTYKQVMYVYNTLLTVFTLGLPRAYSYFLPRVKETQAKSLIKRITFVFFAWSYIFNTLIYIFATDCFIP